MRNRLIRVNRGYLPRLESLEVRLQPGDALLGAWFGTVALTGDTSATMEAGQAKASVSILAPDDLDVLEIIGRPSESVPTRASHQPSRPSTELMDGVETLQGPGTARQISINPIMPPSGGQHFVANASSIVGLAPDAKPSVSVLPGELSKPLSLSPNAARKPAAIHDVDKLQPSARDYGKVPLTFEANQGQTESQVDFIARAGGATVFLTPTAAVFSISSESAKDVRLEESGLSGTNTPNSRGVALHMQIVGGNPNATPVGQERQTGIVNYFIGNDQSQWRTDIPTFGRVQYQDVYPGIDLAYYSNNGQLEYDFIVSQSADPNAITLNFAGADGAEIDDRGNLVLHTAAGDVTHQKPYLYQEVDGSRQEIAGEFVLTTHHSSLTTHQVTFDVGTYDASRPLVIDPLMLGYSTYLGGSGANDDGRGIAVDGGGNAYVTGSTASIKFPATPGAFDVVYNGGSIDTYVAKMNATGSALVYATYLGGSQYDEGGGIAVDGDGNAYVTGYTGSDDFPTTAGAFDTSSSISGDAFVTKLNSAGTGLDYSTFMGGGNVDRGNGIAVDSSGFAYVIGYTSTNDFPTTEDAFDTTVNGGLDAFVAKLSADGSALVYSTFLGGSDYDLGNAIAVDSGGYAYVAGNSPSSNFPVTAGAFDTTYNGGFGDVFVTKLSPDGSDIVYSTFLGGIEREYGTAIAVDSGGAAYVSGRAGSASFPTTPGAFDTTHEGGTCDTGPCNDVFVTKLNAAGSALEYSTFLGGTGDDFGTGIALDSSGSAFVTGYTLSSDFPTTPFAYDATYNGGEDVFIARLNPSGTGLIYSTYFGGSSSFPIGGDYGSAIAVDEGGSVYVAGQTFGSDFPTTPGALKRRNRFGQGDAFVAKFAEA